jgi:hypothetical protein
VQESRLAGLLSFLRFFANLLVVILLVAGGISLGLGDTRSDRIDEGDGDAECVQRSAFERTP